MAKGLKVGDTFKLEFRVTGLWDGGLVSATNPHLPAAISINEAEIDAETVTRGKPKELERQVRYEVGVVNVAPDGKHERITLAKADTREEAEALRENLEAVWIDEIPVKPMRRKR